MTDHAREVLDAIQKIRCLVAESTGRALNLTTDNARLAEILAASRDDLLARIESTQERAVKAEQRNRKAAQLLIEKIGASGPEGVDETATRAVAALASAESQLAAAQAENERLRGELAMYKQLFEHSLSCVDRVFQIDSTKPEPLLPDFLSAGECKFRGVVKLAEAYVELRRQLAERQGVKNG